MPRFCFTLDLDAGAMRNAALNVKSFPPGPRTAGRALRIFDALKEQRFGSDGEQMATVHCTVLAKRNKKQCSYTIFLRVEANGKGYSLLLSRVFGRQWLDWLCCYRRAEAKE